ncbi:MAG: NnrU family protein [Thermodesulfobacteriota bacterium]|nr:NnrU family protein [Thermodesulfobacteriota bacterium]
MSYIVLAVLWIAWCVLHSAMICPSATTYLKGQFKRGFRFYRLLFNVVALATMTPIVFYEKSLDGGWALLWQGPWVVFQIFLYTAAFSLFFFGARHYDLSQFLGIRQIREGMATKSLAGDHDIDTRGILGIMRHPWYAGGLVLVWTRNLTSATLITNVILTGYLIVGAYLEERKLVMEFGDKYRAYQEKVPMFVPYRFLGSKTRKEEDFEH